MRFIGRLTVLILITVVAVPAAHFCAGVYQALGATWVTPFSCMTGFFGAMVSLCIFFPPQPLSPTITEG